MKSKVKWTRKANTWRLQPADSNREFVITRTEGELGVRYELAVLIPMASVDELGLAKLIAEQEAA